MQLTRFAKFCWFVLLINLLVILGGAYVRATGSGAGCGDHWPLCQGQVIPDTSALHTVIEFSHRITSGLALIAVIVLWFRARRNYPSGHAVRAGATGSLIFIVMEALLGAGLVLFEYVAFNVSVARAYWMAAHLVNTFILLLFLTLTAWWASGGAPLQLRGQGSSLAALLAAMMGATVLGASGAITALGDTLVLAGGISPTESAIVARLIDLRIYHPLLAFGVGALLALAVWRVRQQHSTPVTEWLGRGLLAIYVLQLIAGAINVALKAPVWLQLVHLLLADALWIVLVLLAAATLTRRQISEREATNLKLARHEV